MVNFHKVSLHHNIDLTLSFVPRLSVGSECSSQCGCSETMFVPVCTDDGQTYFSPCHAGCRGALLKNNVSIPPMGVPHFGRPAQK